MMITDNNSWAKDWPLTTSKPLSTRLHWLDKMMKWKIPHAHVTSSLVLLKSITEVAESLYNSCQVNLTVSYRSSQALPRDKLKVIPAACYQLSYLLLQPPPPSHTSQLLGDHPSHWSQPWLIFNNMEQFQIKDINLQRLLVLNI